MPSMYVCKHVDDLLKHGRELSFSGVHTSTVSSPKGKGQVYGYGKANIVQTLIHSCDARIMRIIFMHKAYSATLDFPQPNFDYVCGPHTVLNWCILSIATKWVRCTMNSMITLISEHFISHKFCRTPWQNPVFQMQTVDVNAGLQGMNILSASPKIKKMKVNVWSLGKSLITNVQTHG